MYTANSKLSQGPLSCADDWLLLNYWRAGRLCDGWAKHEANVSSLLVSSVRYVYSVPPADKILTPTLPLHSNLKRPQSQPLCREPRSWVPMPRPSIWGHEPAGKCFHTCLLQQALTCSPGCTQFVWGPLATVSRTCHAVTCNWRPYSPLSQLIAWVTDLMQGSSPWRFATQMHDHLDCTFDLLNNLPLPTLSCHPPGLCCLLTLSF